MKPVCCFLLLAACVFPLDDRTEVLIDQDGVSLHQLVKPTSEFTAENIERIFRGMLRKRGHSTGVLKVEVMDDPESIWLLSRRPATDLTFMWWEHCFRENHERIPVFADLLTIGPNAAMRLRDQQGQVFHKVLEGADPYQLSVSGRDMELIHVGISRTGRLDREGLFPLVAFFLVSKGAIDQPTVERALEQLQRTASLDEATVRLRQDAWFATDVDFPVVHPFLSHPEPPSKSEFDTSPNLTCIRTEGSTTCWGVLETARAKRGNVTRVCRVP